MKVVSFKLSVEILLFICLICKRGKTNRISVVSIEMHELYCVPAKLDTLKHYSLVTESGWVCDNVTVVDLEVTDANCLKFKEYYAFFYFLFKIKINFAL